MINRKEITFVENINKKFYECDEKIKLTVDIKNIPQFTINIYEINLETYYRENLSNFDPLINLEGIIPTESQVYNVNT